MFAWNAFILTKWAIKFCSGTEKFRTVNFASHDRVCDNRIKHLIRLWSLIVLSIKVSNLPFWKFDREWAVGMVQAGMTHQAVVDHFNVSRITISRLMICLRQTDRMMTDPVAAGRVWRHNVKTDIYALSSFPPAISTCWLHKQNSYQSPRELNRTYQQSAGVITKFS